jgi:peptidoglycan hydrolase CwlO-like protein
MSMRDQIAEHIYTHVSSMCVVFGEESAADAIIAMPEISNAQAKIAELESALAAASGTIAAMRADAATGQARIAELETRNGKLGDAVAYATQKFTHQEARILQLEAALADMTGLFSADDVLLKGTHLRATLHQGRAALKPKP